MGSGAASLMLPLPQIQEFHESRRSINEPTTTVCAINKCNTCSVLESCVVIFACLTTQYPSPKGTKLSCIILMALCLLNL